MTKLDYYWASNDDWYHFENDREMVVNDDAPQEAQESYKHYLKQKKEKAKYL